MKNTSNNANIYKIADEAGVSKSTVSRVLNNKKDVSEATREKILKVIEDLNYRPDSSAKGLATRKTKTVGLVVSEITNPFFSMFVKGAEDKAMEKDYNIMLANSNWVVEEELKCIRMLEEGRVDGILMISGGGSDMLNDYLNNLVDKETPVVLVDRKLENEMIPKINVDNVDGAYKGTKYLLELGHKNIAFVKGDDIAASYASLDRVEGYRKALQEYGLETEIIEPGYFDREEAHKTTKKILAGHAEVTAVFYASDMMAVGGLKAIKEAGLKVPEDISVLGFDDIELASIIDPALSTIKQPRYKMGYLGMEKLINKLEGKPRELYAEDVKIELELIERESTRSLNY
ncbi:MAG: LacI family DNA-binding transcriptional regulator [Bacillota bacterium]